MSLLTQTAVIKRKQVTLDGQGGRSEKYVTIKVCPGRCSPARGTDIDLAQQLSAAVTHAVYLPPFTELKPQDRVEIDDRVLLITVPNLRPSVRHHVKAFAIEFQAA